MKPTYLFTLVFTLLSLNLFSQSKPAVYSGFPSLVWPKLYNIQFKKATDSEGEYEKPIFSKATKELSGKVVTLPGYMIPFEKGMKGKKFMLSSLPLNACFFCGVGGPESVVEVYMNEELTYTEKPIEIKGILRLNDSNPDQMIYRIEQAEFTGELDY